MPVTRSIIDRLDAEAALDAMIQSFNGEEKPLRVLIEGLVS